MLVSVITCKPGYSPALLLVEWLAIPLLWLVSFCLKDYCLISYYYTFSFKKIATAEVAYIPPFPAILDSLGICRFVGHITIPYLTHPVKNISITMSIVWLVIIAMERLLAVTQPFNDQGSLFGCVIFMVIFSIAVNFPK